MALYDFAQSRIYNTSGAAVSGDQGGGSLNDGAPVGSMFTTAASSFTVGGLSADYVGMAGPGVPAFPVCLITDPAALAGNFILFVDSGGTLPDSLPSAAISSGDNCTACFAAGTEIATVDGFTVVEKLRIGDQVRTLDRRDVAVKWLGRRTVAPKFKPGARVLAVRFSAGSLGGGMPSADLTVTADHAILLGDTLCNAGALVNGTTITRVPQAEMADTVTFYHVETEAHEIILANGAAAETFIDSVARSAFDNFAEFRELYGDVAATTELAYPRAESVRQVPAAIRDMLAAEIAA